MGTVDMEPPLYTYVWYVPTLEAFFIHLEQDNSRDRSTRTIDVNLYQVLHSSSSSSIIVRRTRPKLVSVVRDDAVIVFQTVQENNRNALSCPSRPFFSVLWPRQ